MGKIKFDIIGHKKWWFILSGLLFIISIVSLIFKGLNLGIDFTGGTIYDFYFPQTITITEVRDNLNKLKITNAVIQQSNKQSILIKTKIMNKAEQDKLISNLKNKIGNFEIKKVEMVGPVIGKQLAQQSLLAILISAIGIIIYVAIRFQFKFAVASVLAVLHDAVIVVGIFSVLQKEIDVTFVAAILTIIGYSINDTIVIFDRIRENLKIKSKKENLNNLINRSIYQSLTRTFYTPLTVLFTLFALLFLGGETLKTFTLAMIFGVIIGTYSSIFNASPIVAWWSEIAAKK